VSEAGLFQFGHSKDHRPDLPQVKVNLAVLDPLGLPLSTTVVSGEQTDDPLYVPEIGKVQRTLGQSGMTYVGDCKMAALSTRAYLVASGDHYLCPLSSRQLPAQQLDRVLEPVWAGGQPLTPVYRPTQPGTPAEKLAEGFTYEVTRCLVYLDRTAVCGALHQTGRAARAGTAPASGASQGGHDRPHRPPPGQKALHR